MLLSARERIWRDNHERLYEAALREIQRVGFDHMRIERVCREVRLSRPTFYAHFASKDAIIGEFLGRFTRGISSGLEAGSAGVRDLGSVVDELVRACHYAHAMTCERLRRELVAHFPRHHDIDRFSASTLFRILDRAIVRAARVGEIRAVADSRALARQIVVVVYGFFAAHPNEPERAAREARQVLDVLLRGLRAS